MGFCGSRVSTSTPSLPCCRGQGGAGPAQRPRCPQVVDTDLFSTTAQECGSRWSSRCWKGGLQPLTPSKKNTSPAHRGKGAEAALTLPDLWTPAGWKKSSEHFSKSSLCQKLQSDRCKSQPDPQLLPLLSQPWAASEVTLAPQVAGMAVGSVQVVVGAPLTPPWMCFCSRTRSWGSGWEVHWGETSH